ncbi:MAG TPA: hypothetical protein VG826_08760 [Pirellulales bacterium]|nr:hypothetical protein [Pirellulales bacterium]
MTPRFQFSLGRLLAAVALFALSLWLLFVARESPENGTAAAAAFPIVLGSAVGSLLGRAGIGAMAIIVVYCLLGWLLFQAESDPVINGRRRGVFERRRFSLVSANDDHAASLRPAHNNPVQTLQMSDGKLSQRAVRPDDR